MTKWSLSYEMLRVVIRQFFQNFYRKIESDGLENIPDNKPTIFAANHQNALMDPWGILFTSKQQTVFLTRADIFNNPILLKIFTFFKMLPIYRIRDGKESLKKNEEIFNKSIEILEANMSLGLFPEATHTNKRHLRPLKKAVPRIAFQAEINNNYELDLTIIPVGIYYDDYVHSNSNLFVNYGKPIKIKQFKKEFEENEQKGFNALKVKLEEEIKPLIIHEPDMQHYDLYEGIRTYYRNTMLQKLNLKSNLLKNRFKADKVTVDRLKNYFIDQDNSISNLDTAFNQFNTFCNKKGISTIDTKKPISFISIIYNSLLFLLGLPIFIFAFINNAIYYKLLMKFLVSVKDKQFHTSIKSVVTLLLTFVIYPIQAAILWAISGNGQWALVYLVLLPLTALFANKYRYKFNDFKNKLIFWKLIKSKDYKEYTAKKGNMDKILIKVMS
ncbi:MAG: hypothetical protein DRI86_00045 [Bacteroidetes bacterium]|nr:MAG: hypothetical protein DRI86_00045 [Bacteroidota bacterium]